MTKRWYFNFFINKRQAEVVFYSLLNKQNQLFYFLEWRYFIALITTMSHPDGLPQLGRCRLGRCRTDTCRISTCRNPSCVSQSDFVTHSYWMMRCCNKRKCGLDSMFNVCFRQFCPFHKASSKMLFSCCYVFRKRRSFLTLRPFSNRKPTKRKLIFYLKGWLSIKFYRIIGYPVQLKG